MYEYGSQSICIQLVMMYENDTEVVKNAIPFLISRKLIEGLVELVSDALVFFLLIDKLIF